MTTSVPSTCMIEGCKRRATHLLSLRMRRLDTGADWAPNTPAFFCEHHALDGADVRVYYTPTPTGQVSTEVIIASRPVKRLTPIQRRQGVPVP